MRALLAKGVEAVVVGGSAGSFTALRTALEGLPQTATVPVPIIVVLHIPPKPPVDLPRVLQPSSRWPMKQAEDKEPLSGGRVYFAPPDYHLLIEQERYLSLSLDEPENFSRPSIDVLFESACEVFCPRLLGVLLSGASIDGANGLAAIHAAGGYTAVQTPESSSSRTMPQAALDLFEPTWRLDPAGLHQLFSSL